MLKLGTVHLEWIELGDFELDGGAMFGVVPKALWQRTYPCNENNAIPLTAASLLISVGNYRLVVDTGLGNKLSEKHQRIFNHHSDRTLSTALSEAGINPDSIDYVVLTHMHFDHAGGATYRDQRGELLPVLPHARYLVQETEWEEVTHPNIRSQATYWRENWEPLLEHDRIEVVDGDYRVVDGVEVFHTGGHSAGHQVIKVASNGQVALHLGDLLPTHAHMNPLWVMAYDDYPLESIQQKVKWLKQATEKNWWLTFYHDPFMRAGKYTADGKVVEQVVPPESGGGSTPKTTVAGE